MNLNLVEGFFGKDEELLQIKKLADMTIQELVEFHGYQFEKYIVTTKDGYILELHRLYKEKIADQPVIFMQHGLFASSESYILNGEQSVAYKFANEGYDVWLGNNRGNQYGRKHVTLNPDKKEDLEKFFDYSFYELAKYDLPANIDYVLEKTNQSKISYIGHS